MEKEIKNPLVSVIMPLYNAEKYVAEAIESVINQTYTHWELIIVNDGSTDNSLAVAKKFENEKIKVFTQENKGASSARNYGLREAKGVYIQFLDADDLLSESKIEEQVKSLEGELDKIAVCNCVHFFDGTDPIKEGIYNDESKFVYSTDKPIDFLINLYGGNETLEGWMVQPNSWLTPKSLIQKVGLWNEELTVDDDGEFFCRVILQSKGIVFVQNIFNYYRKYYKSKSLASRKDYLSMESIYLSALLKKKHILAISNSINTKKAIAFQFKNIAIITFPEHKIISKQSEIISKQFGGSNFDPKIGGNLIEIIKYIFGWKLAKWISYQKNKQLF